MGPAHSRCVIVRAGTWLYDGTVERPVDIVALDFDWWYELAAADGRLDEGETPSPLGPEGLLYHARFQQAGGPVLPTWVDTPGFQSLGEAMSAARMKVVGGIRWDPE